MALMPGFIRILKRDHIGQEVRDDGPATHLVKQGTPTMGGLIMLVGVAISVVLVGQGSLRAVAPSGSYSAHGCLGLGR